MTASLCCPIAHYGKSRRKTKAVSHTKSQMKRHSGQEQKARESLGKADNGKNKLPVRKTLSGQVPAGVHLPADLLLPHRKEMMSSTQHFTMSSKPMLACIANESLFSSPPTFSLQDQVDQ